MRRHDSLIPLTHDHHHVLALARRLKAAAGQDAATRMDHGREFLEFFASETVEHFRVEEEAVFPLGLDDPAVEPLLTQAMMDHLRIHRLVAELRIAQEDDDVPGDMLATIAHTLQEHVRLEEKSLFPLIEERLSDDMEAALARVVSAARPPRSQPDSV